MQIDDRLLQSIWEKARVLPDFDPTKWRQDECGAWLERGQYNNANSEFGWKILHVAAGPPDDAASLRPFHLCNGFDVEQGRPVCRIRADRSDFAPGSQVDQLRNVVI
jgi:hypothetical protein